MADHDPMCRMATGASGVFCDCALIDRVAKRERGRISVSPEMLALVHECTALRALVAEGIEAFRLTKEYVNIPDENGFVLLPDVEGWSHWDWTAKALALIEEAGQ